MGELAFIAPDGGIWTHDGTHFPRPVTRFLQSAFREGFIAGFRQGTARYGLMLDHIEPGFVNGFFYNKMVIVGAPPDAKGPPPKFIFKLLTRLHPAIRKRLKAASTAMHEKPWREHIHHWDTVLKPQSTRRHLELVATDVGSMSDARLVDHLRECFENCKAMAYQHHIYTVSCGMPVGDFIAHTMEWTGLSASEITRALRGSTPISQGVTDEYLASLRAIAGDAQAREILASGAPAADVLRRLRALPAPTGATICAYLDLVAHRVTGGYDITCPTAIETPEVLVRSLQALYAPDQMAAEEAAVREAIQRIRDKVPQAHRAQFDELLEEARLVNRLRDERSYWSDLWSSGIARRALLEAGRRLAQAGRIGAVDHVLDATFEEVIGVLDPARKDASPTAGELEARHRFRTTVDNSAPPPALNGAPSPPPPVEWFPKNAQRTMRALNTFMSLLFDASPQANTPKSIRGIAVSAGVYEGTARVIDRAENLHELRQGEVLVTVSTSTSFNYVLPLVGAIVTDRGGLMSHAAIVAREYGLPGVVGCSVATKTIPNGARVRVDADAGEVTILS